MQDFRSGIVRFTANEEAKCSGIWSQPVSHDPIPTRNLAPVTSASLDTNAKINVDGCLESDNVKAIRGMSNMSKPVQLPR